MNTELYTKLTLEEVATDLLYWKASTYLLIVDYWSNREVERAVKTIKSLRKKNDDPYTALTI